MTQPSEGRRLRSVLDIISTVALLAASGVMIWTVLHPVTVVTNRGPEPPRRPAEIATPKEPLSLGGAALKGNVEAKFGLVVFSDFQCPFCAKFSADTLPTLVRKYVDTAQLLLVFRHLPLEALHPHAMRASEIAACASREGRFWSVHDAFFRRPGAADAQEFRQRAVAAGLPKDYLDQCLADGVGTALVRSDMALARSLGIQSTPTSLIGPLVNGAITVQKVVPGARPIEDFERAIDETLRASAGLPGLK